ncbi:aminotransferase class I/II-fold pyridoxal phosphate-dependent enzyme [Saccharicrinis sp. FJH62]|uniref:aminotransferase class I/II-fold pyridoxal phosphate-dependent enzyme n=1 Tax=Saccharicrinis sp. FJH62 TaxID=3344657 RepID=UPI0035D46108
MTHSLIPQETIEEIADELAIKDLGKATIREIVSLVNKTETFTGEKYVRMEMGVPSLPPPEIGINAEIEALKNGVASKYPMLEGHPELKKEASRFFEAFLDVVISPNHIVPVVGTMQGTYISFMTATQAMPDKDHVLFIDPGFPVQKQQLQVMGIKYRTFDVYRYRGKYLADKLDDMLRDGKVACIIYSNPNNPSWICFTEDELRIIAKKADEYNVIIIEDLAYFGMDFRKDLGNPYEPPYQLTVAKYTSNYIIHMSSSKVFSYAGQRVALTAISDLLYERKYKLLNERYGVASFGATYVTRILYALTAGTSHSAQYGLTAMLKAANEGRFRFLDDVKVYGKRAGVMKKMFLDNGFHLVYDKDLDQELADGFYFTIGYKNMTGGELAHKLIYYGISSISLDTTGSRQQGIRACTAFVTEDQFEDLEKRLKAFANDF